MALEQRHQLEDERLQPFRTDGTSCFPHHLERVTKLDPIAPSRRASDQPDHALPPPQHGNRVLAVVAGGKAKSIQQPTPLPPVCRPVVLPELFGQLISILNPHRVLRLRTWDGNVSLGQIRS